MIYEVKAGYRFGPSNQYGPGDRVELTEDEASGFLDKLRPVKESATPAGIEPVEDDRPDPWRGLPGAIVTALRRAQVSPRALPYLSDEDLREIDGIGPKAIAAIKGAFGDGGEV
ncbi:MAG: hypothetical protein H6637_07720 [Ardenticatenales bacterium]|nr:hypothetical protein [Ardenticatenales bacterium]